ncbi:hypothetical protein ACWEQ2_44330 [Streptomyces sp. NPDC004096]|uniref:hypothetical protein n=1 Tax=Streptomyces sp. NPDC057746 TaxID=3346237 RepID=UPI0036A983AD
MAPKAGADDEGGLAVGNVRAATTEEGVVGAVVLDMSAPDSGTLSAAAPEA